MAGAYSALFQGAIYNFRQDNFVTAIRPLTETLTFATPLIAGGLGVALAFRVGMFNIGGRGQILIAASVAGWIGFGFDLPFGIHLLVAVIGGLVGGALWAGIAGLLKARTGAHEVIVTIMLNFVAFYLVSYFLRTPGLLQAPGSSNPKTPAMKETAILPAILGPQYNLHLGFILAIVATILVWWILSRSSLGFKFRAVGINPNAARVAGINVNGMYVYAMLISGALLGLAGISQVLGTVTTGFTAGIDAGHRLRRDHRCPARPFDAVGHLRRGHPLRCIQGRRLLDAGGRGRADRDRARRAVAHRALHRGAPARAHDLRAA